MNDSKIKFDFSVFNKAVANVNEQLKNFVRVFQQSQNSDAMSKKACKANSRRLRYTLKAHSR